MLLGSQTGESGFPDGRIFGSQTGEIGFPDGRSTTFSYPQA